MLETNPGLKKQMPFSLKVRGHNEQARITNMFNYKGCDAATLECLRNYSLAWKSSPADFWAGVHQVELERHFRTPQQSIVKRYLSYTGGDE